jgi:hypothetical protein
LCGKEEIVALCDADENMAAEARKRFPNAKFYFDWRDMLEKEQNNIDAITVSTPDHLHAVVASTAIKMGKHVYCQKPLTQTVHEARYLKDLAKEYGVVTQMGNQGSAEDGLRRAVEVVQAGVIGAVKEIHVWTTGRSGRRASPGRQAKTPVPANLKWDLWLGPAPCGPSRRTFITPSSGGVGMSLARGRWATWPVTRRTCRSGRRSWGIRGSSNCSTTRS